MIYVYKPKLYKNSILIHHDFCKSEKKITEFFKWKDSILAASNDIANTKYIHSRQEKIAQQIRLQGPSAGLCIVHID